MPGALFDGLKEAMQCLVEGSNERQVQFPGASQCENSTVTVYSVHMLLYYNFMPIGYKQENLLLGSKMF